MAYAYDMHYRHATEKPTDFWAKQAADLHWDTPWTSTLTSPDPALPVKTSASWRWFDGGSLNVCYNAVDRHVRDFGRGSQLAISYDSPVTNTRRDMTFLELQDQVSRFAGSLAPPANAASHHGSLTHVDGFYRDLSINLSIYLSIYRDLS